MMQVLNAITQEIMERVWKLLSGMSPAKEGRSQAHMGEAERWWSEASCDSRTTAICDCRLDPAGVLV